MNTMKRKHLTRYTLLSIAIVACLVSCKSNTQHISEENKTTITTILVDLKENSNPETLILDFSEINLQKIKQISRPLNIFLFSFDNTKIEMDLLLSQLKQSSIVENAQSNKETTNRN